MKWQLAFNMFPLIMREIVLGNPIQEALLMNVDADLERTYLAEELRLLGEVLEAVASSASLYDVIQTVGYGIKDLLPSRTVADDQLDASE